MSIKSRSVLNAQSDTNFPDNLNKEITAERLRNHTKDIQDSMVSKKGDTGIQDILRYLSSVIIEDDYDLITKIFADENYAPIGVSDAFINGGNSFGASATIGTNDGEDFLFETDATIRGGITSDGEFMFGTSTPFVNAYMSILGDGSDDIARMRNSLMDDVFWVSEDGSISVKSTMNGATPVFTAYDNADVEVFQIRANANIIAPGQFLDASNLPAFGPYTRNFYLVDGSTVGYNCGTGVFKKTDGQDVANMLFQYLATGGTVDLSWSEHKGYGDWKIGGDLKVGETTNTKSLVMYDRGSGVYRRVFLNNGAFDIEAE